MHDLISRTYDVASAQVSKQQLMTEIADFFEVRAAALISIAETRAPNLVCCGASGKIAGGDRFIQILRTDLSNEGVEYLLASNFSANLEKEDGGRYTLLLDTDVAPIAGDETENTRAHALLPHIVRSVNLSEWGDTSVRVAAEVADELRAQLTPATIVLDETNRVADINDKAASLLQTCNGIREVSGRLELADAVMTAQFRKCVRMQISNARSGPVFLNISTRDGEENLTLLLKRREKPTRGVVIYVRCLRTSSLIVPAHIVQRYELSPKEVRLTVGLLQGKSLATLADEFSVSTHTLRAQIKSVFRKTNVSSQAALILLVLDDHSSVFEH